MDIPVLVESANQKVISGEMRQDAQFYLGIIKRAEDVARILPAESAADGAAFRGGQGDVLQVWFFAGKPAGCCADLVESGMETVVFRADHLR